MERRSNKVLNYIYIYTIASLIAIIWFFSFKIDNELMTLTFNLKEIGFILIGLITFIVLTFFKDTFYMIPLLVFTPFVFSSGFSDENIPIGFYIVIAGAVLGIIMHIIRFRTKVKLGKYFIGLAIFLLGVTFGGIIGGADVIKQLLLIGVGGTLILFAYSFIVSYLKKSYFDELVQIMLALGMLVAFQAFSQQLLLHRDSIFGEKTVDVGWGISNNVAMILLLCIPFGIYKCSESKWIKNFLYLCIVCFLSVVIVLTFSKGSILIALITFPIFLIYSFVSSRHKLSFSLSLGTVICIALALIVYIYIEQKYIYDFFISEFSNIQLNSLTGRIPIYEDMLKNVKEFLLFGRGLFDSPDSNGHYEYMWGHNLYIHAIYTTGFFGLGALLVHLFQKYYVLLKKPNKRTIFVSLAFLACGLYGIIDITYYYLNYMIVMIAILALMEKEIIE